MRNINIASLLTIILFVSCTSFEEDRQETTSPVTLRATLIGGSETKAEFGEFTTSGKYAQICWSKNDALSIFDTSTNAKYITETGGATAEFTLVSETAPTGSSFIGLSPYDENAVATVSSKTITTTIPTEQQAIANTFDPKSLITVGYSSTADKMAFYNACTGFRFTVTGSKISSYASVEIKGNNNENIAGEVKISNIGTSPKISETSNSSTTATLVLPEGSSFKKNSYYYILFRPGVFKKGFTLTFKDSDGNALETCVCSSYVEFVRASIPTVDGADDPKKLAAIRDGDLLSENGTANCYIVSETGSYKFPITRGNETDLISGVDDVKVLWETDNTSGTQSVGSIIKDVKTNGTYIYFNTPSSLKNGNALIAAYKNKEIVWSWHIWVCSGYNPSITSQIYPGKTAAMMDRNLGALENSRSSALSNGLFYQWGRKDPFPGAVESYVANYKGGTLMKTTAGSTLTVKESDSEVGTVDYATANPTTFIAPTLESYNWLDTPDHTLWSSTKTIYDPCPAGWRLPEGSVIDSNKKHVPSKEAWSEVDFQTINYGIYLDLTGGPVWYPNNGYISISGNLLMVGRYSCYWSCSRNGQAVFALELDQTSSSYNPLCYGKVRGEGHSVRCISE